MEKSGLGIRKIIVWDHNRDLMNHRANVILMILRRQNMLGNGISLVRKLDRGEPMFENVKKVQEAYPSKKLIFTEGCVERFDADKYQLWANGERYGRSMINDFSNGSVAWTDWNILLDQNGGPNHVGNFVLRHFMLIR
jgi:glucosylceramidase